MHVVCVGTMQFPSQGPKAHAHQQAAVEGKRVAGGAPREYSEQVAQGDGEERVLEHVGHRQQHARADDDVVVLPRRIQKVRRDVGSQRKVRQQSKEAICPCAGTQPQLSTMLGKGL